MSDINVKFADGTVTTEDLVAIFATVEKSVKVLKTLSLLTPTTVDDGVVVAAEKALEFLRPWVAQPWVPGLVNMAISLWNRPEVRAALSKFSKEHA